jgi:hypothetical protein
MQKIIFDRSIFHGNDFEKLQKSKIKECVRRSKVQVCFTVAFWEETLRLVNKDKRKLEEQLNFLFSIDTGFWFRDIRSIIECECKVGRFLALNDYFFTYAEIQSKRELFLGIADGSVPTGSANEEYKRSVYPMMKRRVEKINEVRKSCKSKYIDFDDFYRSERARFEKEIKSAHKINMLNLSDCPFTGSYLKAYMTCYYPHIKSAHAQDRNNRMDAEQLAYLIYADVIVSNDNKFMRDAFGVLHGACPSKKILSLDEFIPKLEEICG